MDGSVTSFVGIDVSKKELKLCLLPETKSWGITNDAKGHSQLLSQLPVPGTCLIAVEATGGYERLLVAELVNAGHLVAHLNPRPVREFAKALGVLAKTDPIDARILAQFALMMRPRTKGETREKQAELQQFVVRRRQLIELRTAEKNRMETITVPFIRKDLQQSVDRINKQIKRVEKAILALVESDDEWKSRAHLIQTVPGFAQVGSVSLVADLPELGQLSQRKITALVGLAAFNRDSGQFHGQRTIWGGRASARSTLYMAALSARRHNPVIRDFADRLAARGKKPKVILVACMRKLLITLNAMIKNNQEWNPKLALQTP
jgi:transposase